MTLSDLLNSKLGTGLGLGLSRLVQPWVGYPFSYWIADIITSFKRASMVRAVRANQWVVHNGQISAKQLSTLTRDTFRNTARSLYEFWHYFRDPQAVLGLVDLEPSFITMMERAKSGQSGTLIVVPHMANFDLVGRAVALHGLDLHVLSYPQPPGGYRWQNRLRQMPGLLVTPLSIQALRQASQTLRANKAVITGVDRPLRYSEEAKYQMNFFGRPAVLPTFHVRLALKHNLPITVLGGCRSNDGCYKIWASDPIPMRKHPDLVQETVQNAEAVLAVIAEFIRKAPTQWAMYYPVWPEVLDQIPN